MSPATGGCALPRRAASSSWIEDATVWQLTDEFGTYRGQAAMLPRTLDV